MPTKNYHFNNVVIVSGPVVIKDNKILLNKHGESKLWKFPGGDITSATGDLETWAAKKVKEEMGVKIKISRPLRPMVIWKKNEVIILLHYLAKMVGKKIKPAKYVREYAWLDINKLPADCSPNIRPVVAEYRSQKHKNIKT